MEESGQSSSSQNLLIIEEKNASAEAEQLQGEGKTEENSMTMERDTSDSKTPTNQPMNIRELADSAYTLLHECLNGSTRGPSRQPTDDDWTNHGFTSRKTVRCAVQCLVEDQRIVIVDGKFCMPSSPKFGSNWSKSSHQSQSEDKSNCSSLSVSKEAKEDSGHELEDGEPTSRNHHLLACNSSYS